MVKTKKLITLSLLLALALVLNYLETFIPPPAPVPGMRLGLANIITLAAVVLYGRREGAAVLLLRIVMGGIFAGGGVHFIYSLSGGVLSFAAVALLYPALKRNLWVLSVISALAHNIGQVAAAALLTNTSYVFWYILPLTASGIVCGAFTGLAADFVSKHIDKIK